MSYNSTGENKLLAHLPRGKIRSFTQYERGLFYPDMASWEKVLVNTVDYNTSKYFKQNYNRALLEQKLQYKIDLPSHRHLVKMVEEKVQMLNCPLNLDDVRGAEDIWGGNIGCLKGNTPRQKRHASEGKFCP